MEEQLSMMQRVNDFLERRGLRANYVARQVGIGERTFYCFKSGHRLLTQTQLRKIGKFMDDYDKRLDGDIEGGEEQNETGV